MSISSMTGFGQSESTWHNSNLRIELRSVNSRFLEASIKMPKHWAYLESSLRHILRQQVSRGSVTCHITLEQDGLASAKPTFNAALVESYLATAQEIQKRYGLAGEVKLEHILALPDLFHAGEHSEDHKALEQHLVTHLQIAIEALKKMRAEEGQNLALDMNQRVQHMEKLLQQVSELDKQRVGQWREKLLHRVQELMGDIALDPNRVIQEVSLIADRLDITEEITRFHSHNALFQKALQEDANQGKKLNFILQEMGREANTLGTKCQTSEIAEIAISLKEEVEILREQVQNIE